MTPAWSWGSVSSGVWAKCQPSAVLARVQTTSNLSSGHCDGGVGVTDGKAAAMGGISPCCRGTWRMITTRVLGATPPAVAPGVGLVLGATPPVVAPGVGVVLVPPPASAAAEPGPAGGAGRATAQVNRHNANVRYVIKAQRAISIN